MLYRDYVVDPTSVLIKDQCPVGLPKILNLAQIAAVIWEFSESALVGTPRYWGSNYNHTHKRQPQFVETAFQDQRQNSLVLTTSPFKEP